MLFIYYYTLYMSIGETNSSFAAQSSKSRTDYEGDYNKLEFKKKVLETFFHEYDRLKSWYRYKQ